MSFIIRSSNGERSAIKVRSDSNPNSNKRGAMSMREEIADALAGLTIKFELKISDVIIDDNQDEANTVESKPQPGTVDDILPNLISSLPKTREAPAARDKPTCNIRPKLFNPSRTETAEKKHEVDIMKPKVDSIPKDQSYSIESKVGPVDANISHVQANASLAKTSHVEAKISPPEANSSPVEMNAPQIQANSLPVDLKTSKQPSKISSNPLVKGTLKIGSVTKSGCIWLDENNAPYISYDNKRLIEITRIISDLAIHIETQPQVNSVDVGDIVFAKSKDDNAWYRAVIERKGNMEVDVFMFDWGGTETLDLNRIRRLTVLELGLSAEPANAMRVNIQNPPGPIVDKFLECEAAFDIRVESYHDADDAYAITILGPSDEKSGDQN